MPDRRTFISLAAAAATAAAVCPVMVAAAGGLVDVRIIDRDRVEPLATYTHRGTQWVAGTPGSRYAVRLTNRTGGRVLVVLSIDGINAVSGETAATGQTGYVLAPWQTTEITGWRKSLTEAAAFYFTSLPDSYAARTDRPDNVGVIGAAVFREKEREVSRTDEGATDSVVGRCRSNAAEASARPAPSATAPSRAAEGHGERQTIEDQLGTGHGEREWSPASQTAFERAGDRPGEVVRIRYDSPDRLTALGVIPPRRAPAVPDPFPRFVADPRG